MLFLRIRVQEAHEDKIESLCITYTATRIGSYASKLVFVAMLTSADEYDE